jgi:long-chain acyl-CoA synthetase
VSQHVAGHSGSDAGLGQILLDHPAEPDTPILTWGQEFATLGQLTEAAETLAVLLAELGLGASAPVACVVRSGASAIATMFATWLAGGVYVPLNGRLTDAELEDQLAETEPAVVIVAAGEVGRVPAAYSIVEEFEHWSWRLERADHTARIVSLPVDGALLMRTSGTVAAPKAILLHHQGVLLGIDTVVNRLRNGNGTRAGDARTLQPNLIPTSLALWAGIWNTLFALRIGATVVLMDRFDSLEYARLVRELGLTSTVLSPAMMTALAEDGRVVDLSPLRYVRSITAPLLPSQARRFRDRFGVTVLNSYGQTELGSEIAGWTTGDVRKYGDSKLGAVGRLHPGVELRVVGEDGQLLAPGATGELYIRSPFADGDVGARAVERDRLVDGFLQTGDIGRLDDEGFIWIEGRTSDMINRGGLKLMPGEVEDALRAQPGIVDACVAGVPDNRLGEVPVAWLKVSSPDALDRQSLDAALRQTLAGYKLPVAYRVVDGDFPRSEIGKVLRRELVRSYVPSPDRHGDLDGGSRRPVNH